MIKNKPTRHVNKTMTKEILYKTLRIIDYSKIPFSKNSHHIGISSLICPKHLLVCFYLIRVSIKKISEQSLVPFTLDFDEANFLI